MPSGMSEKAWSVPFEVCESVKCFSIIRAPEHVRDERHRDAVLMVGQTDTSSGMLAEGRDDPSSISSDSVRIGGGALEDARPER